MFRWFVALMVILLPAGLVFAQPDPERPQPEVAPAIPKLQQIITQVMAQRMTEQRTQILQTAKALFVLRGGVLAKYDATTLDMQTMVELFGPMPALPAGENGGAADKQRWLLEQAKRLMPAAMLQTGNDLLLVISEQFFRVDTATLKLKVKATLAPDGDLAQNIARRLLSTFAVPALELHDTTLYIAHGDQLLSVNINDGKILATGALPAQMQVGILPGADPLARLLKRAKLGKLDPAAAQAAPTTAVGTMVKHAGDGETFWTVKCDNGDEYVLTGDKLPELLATPKIDGARVRVTGGLTRNEDVPQFGQGNLEVENYQVLP